MNSPISTNAEKCAAGEMADELKEWADRITQYSNSSGDSTLYTAAEMLLDQAEHISLLEAESFSHQEDASFMRDRATEHRERAAAAVTELAKMRAAVELLYEKWENGDDCHDETGAFLGKAFRLSESEDASILALIK